jgi:putative ubiquitin-RnfH superfamily antitoxin RatB of RatAB toxin-antitoxin module
MSPSSQAVASGIEIEVCWVEASPEAVSRVWRRSVQLTADVTVRSAIEALGHVDLMDQLVKGALTAAVFGEHVTLQSSLNQGDRIELLSGLEVDPKLSRARRAEVQRSRRGDVRWQRR